MCSDYTGLCLDFTGLRLDDKGLWAVFEHTHTQGSVWTVRGCVWTTQGCVRTTLGELQRAVSEGKGDYLKSSENNVNSTEPCFFSENNVKNRRTMSTLQMLNVFVCCLPPRI